MRYLTKPGLCSLFFLVFFHPFFFFFFFIPLFFLFLVFFSIFYSIILWYFFCFLFFFLLFFVAGCFRQINQKVALIIDEWHVQLIIKAKPKRNTVTHLWLIETLIRQKSISISCFCYWLTLATMSATKPRMVATKRDFGRYIVLKRTFFQIRRTNKRTNNNNSNQVKAHMFTRYSFNNKRMWQEQRTVLDIWSIVDFVVLLQMRLDEHMLNKKVRLST